MNNPDFFIAGAPKSGTTALYHYLNGHPNIFLPELKEPHFWCEDYPSLRRVRTLEEYQSLFSHRKNEHLVSGEASVSYLGSEVALKLIAEFNPESKIILLLRNPVEMVQAFHSELLWNQNEDVDDFEKAWGLQNERKMGRSVPSDCLNPKFLMYRDYASYGDQVERLFESFSKEQIKVFTFDEFVCSVKEVYENILSFLEVPSDDRSAFPRINENKTVRSRLLAKLVTRPPQPVLWAVKSVKQLFGLRHLGVSSLYLKINRKSGARRAVSPQFREKLIDEFRSDIDKLERLIDKDLSNWKC